MERKIDNFFHKWKKDLIRKPLILYGPKQVGKTFSALNFGEKEYKNIAYLGIIFYQLLYSRNLKKLFYLHKFFSMDFLSFSQLRLNQCLRLITEMHFKNRLRRLINFVQGCYFILIQLLFELFMKLY